MVHFGDARRNMLAALAASMEPLGMEQACLIVDVQGVMRVAVWPGDSAPSEWRESLNATLGADEAAGGFWSHEIWDCGAEDAIPRDLANEIWRLGAQCGDDERLRVLDRYMSKDAWVGDPFEPPWSLRSGPPIVSFWSFKGGVGRSTCVAATAANLASRGLRVVVLDADIECPGLHAVLAPDDPALAARYGLVDYWIESLAVGRERLEIGDYHYECELGDGDPVIVVPAGVVDDDYIGKLARVSLERLEPGPQFPIAWLIEAIHSELRPDIVLIDSRSGLDDMGGLAISGAAHLQVLIGVSSPQTWSGVRLAVSHLGADMVGRGLSQRECMMVHAMVSPDPSKREDQVREYLETSYDVFLERYYDEPGAPDAEWPQPDLEYESAPHYPSAILYSESIAGYGHVRQVLPLLRQGGHLDLARRIADRVGLSSH